MQEGLQQTMRHLTTALFTVATLAVSPLAAASDLVIHDPWVREMPPVADNSAGYMRIENPSDTDRSLVDAESDLFGHLEIHESVEEDGTMRMEHREELVIPAGGEAVLEPGGYHVMLIDRHGEPLKEGDEVAFTLIFADGHTQEVVAPVLRHGPDGEAGDDHDDHHGDHHGDH